MTEPSLLSFEEVHDVMLDHGDDRPIWLTESLVHRRQCAAAARRCDEGAAGQFPRARPRGAGGDRLRAVAIVYNFRNN